MTTTENTKEARQLLRRVREIERNQRLGRYVGRNSRSTDADLTAKKNRAEDLMLRSEMPHRLSGLLTEEHKTAVRLQLAAEAEQERPELLARQRETQRQLRAEMAV